MAKVTGFAEGLDMPVREKEEIDSRVFRLLGGKKKQLLFTEIEVTRSPSLVYFALGGF